MRKGTHWKRSSLVMTALAFALAVLFTTAGIGHDALLARAVGTPPQAIAKRVAAAKKTPPGKAASSSSAGIPVNPSSAITSASSSPGGTTIGSSSGTVYSQVTSVPSYPASSATGSTSSASPSSAISSSPAVSSSPVPSSSAVSSSVSGASQAVSPPFVHPARISVGYYGGWAAYSGYTPDKIKASNLTVISYAFATIGSDLKIAPGDPYIDYSNYSKLRALKSAYPGLQTVISVGGWDDSGRFSDAALTDASRAAFADSVVGFLKAYGFDGVDIDWEYPTGGGLSTNVSRPADKTNFGLLLKALRSRLDAQGALDRKHYILSFAGAANGGYAAGVGVSGLAPYVDYAMIMTYDLHGNWDSYTDFNAPLYLPSGSSPQYKSSVDGAVLSWLNSGFPAGKLVMGVPFYGYVYQGISSANNGLWQRFTSGSAVGYDSIQSKYAGSSAFTRFYSSSAMVPWLFGNSVFVSYDDVSSIQKKTQYAVSKNLLGVGAWELSFDRNGTLLSTVRSTLG